MSSSSSAAAVRGRLAGVQAVLVRQHRLAAARARKAAAVVGVVAAVLLLVTVVVAVDERQRRRCRRRSRGTRALQLLSRRARGAPHHSHCADDHDRRATAAVAPRRIAPRNATLRLAAAARRPVGAARCSAAALVRRAGPSTRSQIDARLRHREPRCRGQPSGLDGDEASHACGLTPACSGSAQAAAARAGWAAWDARPSLHFGRVGWRAGAGLCVQEEESANGGRGAEAPQLREASHNDAAHAPMRLRT
eukprot:scaffold1318_cov388-Prasinococcus_capsulatus_cf.AAC.61